MRSRAPDLFICAIRLGTIVVRQRAPGLARPIGQWPLPGRPTVPGAWSSDPHPRRPAGKWQSDGLARQSKGPWICRRPPHNLDGSPTRPRKTYSRLHSLPKGLHATNQDRQRFPGPHVGATSLPDRATRLADQPPGDLCVPQRSGKWSAGRLVPRSGSPEDRPDCVRQFDPATQAPLRVISSRGMRPFQLEVAAPRPAGHNLYVGPDDFTPKTVRSRRAMHEPLLRRGNRRKTVWLGFT